MPAADVTSLILWDDARARSFEPFALTRPVGELRAGMELLRARWERVAGAAAAGFVGAPHLGDFEEPGAPAAVAGELPAGTIVANARCAVALDARLGDRAAVWRCEGRVAAVRLARPVPATALPDDDDDALLAAAGLTAASPCQSLAGRWIDEVWHLLRDLAAQLADDIAVVGPRLRCALPDGITVLGAHPIYVEAGAVVEPLVVMDATAGPLLVRRGATIAAFTRLVGPLFVDEGSSVGGKVANCSIGPVCRVHGEMSTVVFVGHANKAHDGFVGHSIVGRWVNVGAGTITSNLKNTYGTVALWTPTGTRDTGMQFLGALFGDHVKTGIGVRLTTGTVLGAGANVYGSAMPPKVVPPFAWGDGVPYASYDLARFVQTVERMMARRQMVLGSRGRCQLEAAHAARWTAAE